MDKLFIMEDFKNEWLWGDKPYSRFTAFMDLIIMASGEKDIRVKNEIIHTTDGELITTHNRLLTRWGWSKSKMLNYLQLLEGYGVIQVIPTREMTRIIIINSLGIECVKGDMVNERNSIDQ